MSKYLYYLLVLYFTSYNKIRVRVTQQVSEVPFIFRNHNTSTFHHIIVKFITNFRSQFIQFEKLSDWIPIPLSWFDFHHLRLCQNVSLLSISSSFLWFFVIFSEIHLCSQFWKHDLGLSWSHSSITLYS